MKKFILAVLATSILASPIAMAPAQAQGRQDHPEDRRDRPDGRQDQADGPQERRTTVVREGPRGNTVVTNRTVIDNRDNHRRWNKGQRFDRRYAQNYREISDWRAYRARRLYAPPRGYHWVRSGNDAVLVAVSGGLIGAVLAGAFN